jgi:hypothetical protein
MAFASIFGNAEIEDVVVPAGDPGERLIAKLILSTIAFDVHAEQAAGRHLAEAHLLAMDLANHSLVYRPLRPSHFARLTFEFDGITEATLLPLINNVLVFPAMTFEGIAVGREADVHGILLGIADGHEVFLEPYRGNILIAGKSGIGKSTLATALTERMAEKKFVFCVFDPEGDYDQEAVSVGNSKAPPSDDEAIKLLQTATNVVINTQCLSVNDRPGFFSRMLPQVSLLRATTGRPHWLVIDEAHHLLPASRDDVARIFPKDTPAAIFITVHPDAVSPDALKGVDVVVALGEGAKDVISKFCGVIGIAPPEMSTAPGDEEVLVWMRSSGQPVRAVKPARPQQVHKRHTRKYAECELGEELSGPDGALNLRAQNLMLFLQIARGVDDRTWDHHLRKGDYSVWFQTVIKDNELARETADVEANQALDPSESRQLIEEAVTQRYTAPASDE